MVPVCSSAEKCLKNIKILQNIFDHVSEDPTDNLNMRLVNRLFDAEYLHRIRRTHRSIFLRFLEDDCDRETETGFYVLKVNERVIRNTEAEKYFKFLAETVGVRVESLRTRGASEFYAVYPDQCIAFHTVLMEKLLKNCRLKSLTGLEDMCPKGCSECVRHARTCEEYGPLQMNVYLDSYQEPRHYKKLIVSEVLLHELANQAVYQTKTKKDCLEFVKIHQKPNISCRDFCLSLSEFCFRHYHWQQSQEQFESFNEVYPREIIEEICRSWKPKSVQVVVGSRRFAFESRSDWRLKNFFTEFAFKQKLSAYEKKQMMEIGSLEIDIQRGFFASYFLYNEYPDGEISYNYLIANFRNLFPSKTVSVKTYRFPSTRQHPFPEDIFDETTFRNILKTVWKKNPAEHWELTLNHMLTVPSVEYQIPETLFFMNRRISCVPRPTFPAQAPVYDYKTKKDNFTQYTVQPYRITDEARRCVLNFQLFFETKTT